MATRFKIFDHLIDNVLEQNDDSELQRALRIKKITTLPSLLAMHTSVIKSLSYCNDDGKSVSIHRFYHGLIFALRSYIYYKQSIGVTDYLTLTQDDFDMNCVSIYDVDEPHQLL